MDILSYGLKTIKLSSLLEQVNEPFECGIQMNELASIGFVKLMKWHLCRVCACVCVCVSLFLSHTHTHLYFILCGRWTWNFTARLGHRIKKKQRSDSYQGLKMFLGILPLRPDLLLNWNSKYSRKPRSQGPCGERRGLEHNTRDHHQNANVGNPGALANILDKPTGTNLWPFLITNTKGLLGQRDGLQATEPLTVLRHR